MEQCPVYCNVCALCRVSHCRVYLPEMEERVSELGHFPEEFRGCEGRQRKTLAFYLEIL